MYVHSYPVHACATGLSNRFVSVSTVSQWHVCQWVGQPVCTFLVVCYERQTKPCSNDLAGYEISCITATCYGARVSGRVRALQQNPDRIIISYACHAIYMVSPQQQLTARINVITITAIHVYCYSIQCITTSTKALYYEWFKVSVNSKKHSFSRTVGSFTPNAESVSPHERPLRSLQFLPKCRTVTFAPHQSQRPVHMELAFPLHERLLWRYT